MNRLLHPTGRLEIGINKWDLLRLPQQQRRQSLPPVLLVTILEQICAFLKQAQIRSTHHYRRRKPSLPNYLSQRCWSVNRYLHRCLVMEKQRAFDLHAALTSLARDVEQLISPRCT